MGWLRSFMGWVWEHVDRIALLVGWAVTGGLVAWAAKKAAILDAYAPFSWVMAGLGGLLLAAVIYRIGVAAYRQQVRSRYDARLLAQGGAVDPLAKTYEGKRIFLNDFILPSHPLIEGKTFINCQIIGPANVILVSGNTINEPKLPYCDAVLVPNEGRPLNGFAFTDCTFRECSFQRVTFLIPLAEYERGARTVNWLNWITAHPDQKAQMELLPTSNVSTALEPQSPVVEAITSKPSQTGDAA